MKLIQLLAFGVGCCLSLHSAVGEDLAAGTTTQLVTSSALLANTVTSAALAVQETVDGADQPLEENGDAVVVTVTIEPERELLCYTSALKQCGGRNYYGCTGCPSGYTCKYSNTYWSDCQKSTTSTSCTNKSLSQCGGKNFSGNKCCPSGYYCKYINTYWSDCQRGVSGASAPPPGSGPVSLSGLPSRSYSVSVPSQYKTPVRGETTYYGIVMKGNCGFDKGSDPWHPSWQQHFAKVSSNDPDKFWPLAVDTTMFQKSKACGMCLVATLDDYQPNGEYYGWFNGVRFGIVVDQCPDAGCNYGHIDWRGVGNGRFKHSWIAIECPVERERTNFLYYKVPASSTWYLKFQVRNSRIPITRGRIRFSGRGWADLNFPPDGDNFFTFYCGGGAYCTNSFDIEMTSQFGTTVTDYGIDFNGDMAYGNAQFSSKQT